MTISFTADSAGGQQLTMYGTVLNNYWTSQNPALETGRIGMGTWAGRWCEYVRYPAPSPTKTISGEVREQGVACARTVRLYERATGLFISATTSNAVTGAFSFANLDSAKEYFVVAFDAAGDPNFNALIFDKIIPA